jgi:adenylate cyclase
MCITRARSVTRAGTDYDERPVTPQQAREMRALFNTSAAEAAALMAANALCEYLNRWNDAGPAEVARARSAVDDALALDPAFYLAHYARGFLCRASGQHADELAAFDETIRRNPDFARAHAQRGEALLYLGQAAEAIVAVDESIRRNPTSKIRGYFYWVKGRSYFYQQQYTEAIDWLERSVRNWPHVWYNRAYLISAHALSGNPGSRTAARRVLRSFDARFPGYTVTQVIDNERATPDNIRSFVAMRHRFQEGLRLAGMPP